MSGRPKRTEAEDLVRERRQHAADIAAAVAAERQRCADLARQVRATFTSSYSFTTGRTKTLQFADYLLAGEMSDSDTKGKLDDARD